MTLSALADPTRRALLLRLARGKATVTELAQPFPISLNSVSKHIRVLEEAGLLRRARVGREHVLSLDPGSLDQLAEFVEGQRTLWKQRLAMLDELLEGEDRGAQKPARKRRSP